MLRWIVSLAALLAFVSTPVVARTRMICRYTGVEITDCPEQHVPAQIVIQAEGCCNQQISRGPCAALSGQGLDIAPPALQAFPGTSPFEPLLSACEAWRGRAAASPTGPPLFLITRALLI